jgi:hypothetical protein
MIFNLFRSKEVNYLAHYYCLPFYTSELHVFGSLLPDIFPRFTKFYSQKIKNQELSSTESNIQILEGIHLHFKIDDVFHKRPLFTENMEFIKVKLNKYQLNNKNYVVAHLMVEFMIDRLLILQNDKIANNFYKTCNQIKDNLLLHFFKNRINNEEFSNFMLKFKLFLENEYAYRLKVLENIPQALSFILKNRLIINEPLNEEIILEVLELTETNMKQNYLNQLQEIKEIIA